MPAVKPYERDYFRNPETYTYEYFYNNVLNTNKNTVAEALGIADEELLTYYNLKLDPDNNRFFFRLDPYNKRNYQELEYFTFTNLQNVIKERIDDTISDKILDDISQFNYALIFLNQSFSNTETTYLFKKISNIISLDYSVIRDVLGRFPLNSLFFSIDLFAVLNANKKLYDFFDKLLLPESQLKYLANKPFMHLNMWPHQIMALEEWLKADKKGILEMATATGKTVIGLAAISHLAQFNDNLRVLVLTHSRAILNQWRREAIDKLGIVADPDLDYNSSLFREGNFRIEFNTLQTVYKYPHLYETDLLIVDEVHHGAGKEYREALNVPCKWKMGLSATITGKGEGKNVLYSHIGKTCFKFGLSDACKKGVIPEFKLFIHKTYLAPIEDREFKDISKKIINMFDYINSTSSKRIRELSEGKFSRFDSISDFISLVKKCNYNGKRIPEEWLKLQGLIFKRRPIIHKSSPKIENAIKLAKNVGSKKKCVLFAMNIDTCENIYKALNGDINAYIVHSDLNERQKENSMREFRNCSEGVLIAPKILDEGIDIPDADVGINVSSAKTELQLVQRMGRILRKSPGKKPIFHHFVALPHTFIDSEDSFSYLNDLAWIYDITTKMGIDAQMYDPNNPEILKLEKQSEKFAYDYYFKNKKIISNDFGTINMRYIVQSISEEPKQKLIDLLDGIHGFISDSMWLKLLREAHEKQNIHENIKMVDLPNHRWLLIISGRNPRKLKEFLESYE
ncbi:DEAD/DEAH box helicase [Methanohalophilus sp. RSK]|uniref:DEAD/DEAH box helicase n=1 Tax=Methanohalophilus sp. RSK TaxID=2485783 RepID=UPI000F43B19B|nr:DEAD/DEAH box helicase [Methanohalophilus sp. RSK]RNI11894.1 DEAD/DEAH box helicase [Methanohalophilus sp. RSK]